MLHSTYEMENLSRQLPAERFQEAENERLVARIKHENQEREQSRPRGLGSRFFNRRALKVPPLEASRS
jgi:hypothetical protein